MSIYDINFNQQANDLLPPDKRMPKNTKLLQAVFSALQWCRDLVLGSYANGSTAPKWSPGSYNQYQQVIFQKTVYESLINNNTDQPTTSNWRIIQSNFLGAIQRVKFNSSHCILEYALNNRFGGTFRIPPSVSLSDIYISNALPIPIGLRVGNSIGSSVGNSMSSDPVYNSQTFRINGFIIHVPNSIMAMTSVSEITDFVNPINTAGITFTIVTY